MGERTTERKDDMIAFEKRWYLRCKKLYIADLNQQKEFMRVLERFCPYLKSDAPYQCRFVVGDREIRLSFGGGRH